MVQMEDDQKEKGVRLSKELMSVAGEALKANVRGGRGMAGLGWAWRWQRWA